MAKFTPVNPMAWQLCGSGHRCCPGCAQHYEEYKAIEEPQNSGTGMNIVILYVVDFMAAGTAGPVGQHELVKATSAAQQGVSALAIHQWQLLVALAASSGHVHQVMIYIALHHLKPKGKSGMELVGCCKVLSHKICRTLNVMFVFH
ncbi:hypothetical protein BDR03DRAFT_982848 [Suillus americanus]|nr:hypothetical protein BDR03DRAFT_982848 [Suillus americanus]